jgi:hypothetical protein
MLETCNNSKYKYTALYLDCGNELANKFPNTTIFSSTVIILLKTASKTENDSATIYSYSASLLKITGTASISRTQCRAQGSGVFTCSRRAPRDINRLGARATSAPTQDFLGWRESSPSSLCEFSGTGNATDMWRKATQRVTSAAAD